MGSIIVNLFLYAIFVLALIGCIFGVAYLYEKISMHIQKRKQDSTELWQMSKDLWRLSRERADLNQSAQEARTELIRAAMAHRREQTKHEIAKYNGKPKN